MRRPTENEKVHEGTANVFADLGLAHADDRKAKAGLAVCIERRIEERGLTHQDAAVLLGIREDLLEQLKSGRFLLKAFTYDDLFRFLATLGCNVWVEVEPASPTEHGTIQVQGLVPPIETEGA